jgi:predicted GIY-YIG superfamily endonuclease
VTVVSHGAAAGDNVGAVPSPFVLIFEGCALAVDHGNGLSRISPPVQRWLLFAGHTDHLESRLAQHQMGLGGSYIAPRRLVALVFMESFGTRDEALTAERRSKNWSRAKKQALIEGEAN